MNSLGLALVWSSVPVTLVAAVALVLERLASRRGPAPALGFGRFVAGHRHSDAAGDLRAAAALVLANTVLGCTWGGVPHVVRNRARVDRHRVRERFASVADSESARRRSWLADGLVAPAS